MIRRPGILSRVVITLFCLSAARGAVVFVDGRVGDCGDGAAWATAYKYLQDALAGARDSGGAVTEIWVAAGTYRPDRDCSHPGGTGDRTATFELVDGVALRGGFAGTEDPASFDLNSRDFDANMTVLSGDLAADDPMRIENSYRVVTASGVGASTILEGFAISGGNANGSNPLNSGGGLYSAGSGLLAVNCIFSGNRASALGGGSYQSSGSTMVLTNCTFHDNTYAVYSADSSTSLTNCTVSGNTYGVHSSSEGGVHLANSIVWGNRDEQIAGPATVRYSCVQGGWEGVGNVSGDPRLMFVGGGNLRLRRGSACIDAGDNASLDGDVTTDCAGGPRFVDDPETPDTGTPGDPPRAVVDMGAYEYQPSAAERLYVRAGAAPDGNGHSWATPYPFLQDALSVAHVRSGVTEIWVAAGTYYPDRDASHPGGTADRKATFHLPGGVALYGGFPGLPGQEGDLLVRDPGAHVSRLSGDISGENSHHVVTTIALGPSAVVDGFTISEGTAPSDNYGAGMYNTASDLSLANCTFSGNSAPSAYDSGTTGGGGMYNRNSSPSLTNCTFTANSAKSSVSFAKTGGGGMYNYKSSPTLVNCTFSNNTATQASGGAICNVVDSSPTLTNCTFIQNQQCVGTVANRDRSHPILTDCDFVQNTASYNGGALYNVSSCSPVVTGCTFRSNSAVERGAAVYNTIESHPMLTGCVFRGNSAGTVGGGLANQLGSNPVLTHCTFTENSASAGAGVYNSSSNPAVINCAFSNNSASQGGGMFNYYYSGSRLVNCTFSGNSGTPGGISIDHNSAATLTNCIIWGNGSNLVQITGSATATFCCIQGGWPGTGNISSDPRLMFVAGGNLHLRRGSPGIDAGDNTALSAEMTVDLDGNPRFVDDPDTEDTAYLDPLSRPAVDMGAYEYSPVEAERLYVAANAAEEGDGQSWATALPHLQDALRLAQVRPGLIEIWVAAGLYKPDRDAACPGGTADRTATFRLVGGVTLYGGFPGRPGEEGDSSVRDPSSHVTSLSGDLSDNDGPGFVNNGENSYQVVTADAVGPAAVLDGFSITGGNADGSSPDRKQGGGLYNLSGSPTIAHCTFSENSASLGGAVFNGSDCLTLVGCRFSQNSAVSGGGLYNTGGNPVIAECTFSNNVASGGGGLYNTGSALNVTRCTFMHNSASAGGGVYNANSSGNPMLTSCLFTGNTASSNPGHGGGLFNAGSGPILTNCVFTGNSASAGGGAYNEFYTHLTLINCTVTGNAAATGGGFSSVTTTGRLRLTNCILWGNTTGQVSGSAIVNYSCVQSGWSGTGNIAADPRLVTGRDGIARLHYRSPCIDAGDSTTIPAEIATDFFGNARCFNDPDTPDTGKAGEPAQPVVDIGAYEYQPVSGDRLYVNAAAAPGGDGRSWAGACRFLQDALAIARLEPRVTELWVAGGVYRPDRSADQPGGSSDRSSTFRLLNEVSIYGGFPGGAGQEDDISVRQPAVYVTVLSGDLAGNDGPGFANNGENSYHVVTAEEVMPITCLDGVTISAGNANGGSSSGVGGGFLGLDGSPRLRNCRLSGNFASIAGGGIYSDANSSSAMIGCTLIRNVAGGQGGGLYVANASPAIVNCTLAGNSANEGGGVYVLAGSPKLMNCVLWSNSVSQIQGNAVVTYSCVQGGRVGTGNISADPLFVSNADLRFRPGSPCIDAGSNAAVPAGVVTDLAGLARFRNDPATADCRWAAGTCGAGAIVDMGAYEYVPGDFDRDGDIDADDASTFLGCSSGPSVPYGGDCVKADLDGDGDVDQVDFGILQSCYSGLGREVDPRCSGD